MTCQCAGNHGKEGAERGIALLVTMMVLVLVSVLMAGFVTVVISDQHASGAGGDQTQTYGAAHAGLEKLTSDLSALFVKDFSPSAAQINALTAAPPVLPGFQFLAPDNSAGYTITFDKDASGNPKTEDVNGTMISSGAYQGFRGIITPYSITVTARSRGKAEVRMRRTVQTIAIPVFQFGIFSENDLSFFAGPSFDFGGRVHTNSNLFLAEGDGTLTMADRVTAVGEVIRTNLSNGWPTSSSYMGIVKIITSPNSYRNLTRAEGSLADNVGSAINEPAWTNLSIGDYAGNIRNGRTGAKRLDLPLVSQGAIPIDLIRRPPLLPPDESAAKPVIFQQRLFAQAAVRILLSDTAAQITKLPTVTSTTPVQLLAQTIAGVSLAVSDGPGGNPAAVYKSRVNQPLLNGFIKIERRDTAGVWKDVTAEVLALGIAARNLADISVASATRWNTVPSAPLTVANACLTEPQPNAVIRLQRVRDVPQWPFACGINPGGNMNGSGSDYWPLALYDTREGNLRDSSAGATTTLALGGIMNYIELDVGNLRKYLLGQFGGSGAQTLNDNGYVVYFSDRRNNKNVATETGEYGFEDVINPADVTGQPNGTMDFGEDINGSGGAVETYGRLGVNEPLDPVAPYTNGGFSTATITDPSVARANRPVHFRRALKIVNGGGAPILPGLTVASENPVYVQGNYNAGTNDTLANPHGAYSIIADAVTLLSNNWNDIRSFVSPNNPGARRASETGYRVALIAGKSLSFPRPTAWGSDQDFGTDGGAHNFLRYLESWDGVALNYRGSLISLFTSRQAVGTYKCCTNVYGAPNRTYVFDSEFLTPALLPPATPMFRDVNTLTFRQLLRPNQ